MITCSGIGIQLHKGGDGVLVSECYANHMVQRIAQNDSF